MSSCALRKRRTESFRAFGSLVYYMCIVSVLPCRASVFQRITSINNVFWGARLPRNSYVLEPLSNKNTKYRSNPFKKNKFQKFPCVLLFLWYSSRASTKKTTKKHQKTFLTRRHPVQKPSFFQHPKTTKIWTVLISLFEPQRCSKLVVSDDRWINT